MKKLFLLTAFVAFTAMATMAQNDTIFHMADITEYGVEVCINKYDRAVIYGDENCNNFSWNVNGNPYYDNPLILEFDDEGDAYSVNWFGCGILYDHGFYASTTAVPNSATIELWKHQNESLTLAPIGADSVEMFDFRWSTDETTSTIEVAVAGTYTCSISDHCGTATRTFIVRDNVELFRATTNLTSNCNQATWQTTPEQAEYVQEVNVYRNNQLVATVPYTDGVFTDNIGSADAPWQYHLVAVSNGEECPLRSYWARTISMSDLMGSQGTQTLTWTSYEQENPAKGDEVQSYGIFDVVGGNPRLVIEVGSFVNMYNYDPSNFDGYAAVAAIFSRDGKSPLDFEDCAFSNRTEAPLGLGEHEAATFSVYPNPSNGVFTVEGAGQMTITNVLGQTVLAREIDGMESIGLPQGLFFLKLNGTTRKIVVE